MKDRECIMCEKIFDCKGKPNKKPCLSFEERKKRNDKQQTERRKI